MPSPHAQPPSDPRIKKHIAEGKASVWSFFIRHPKMAILALIASLLGGTFSLFAMPLESAPEVKIPIGVVSTAYPGANPADIESLITDKIEKKLANLADVKKITSTSMEGVSSVVVEFDADADLTESIRSLRDEVSTVSDLPEDATDPVVIEIRADDQPIVTFSLLGDLSPGDFKTYADELQEELEAVPGVQRVEVAGVTDRQYQVLIDPAALTGYGLSLGQVTGAIQAANIDMPVGVVTTDEFNYSVSLKGQFSSTDELAQLPIGQVGGESILLRDIAAVAYLFAEKSSASQVFRTAEGQADEAVTLQVYKRTGANLVDAVDTAKAIATQFDATVLPESADILVTNDFSEYIREDINRLGGNALLSVILVSLVLLVALGWREALLAAFSLPIIFLVSFIILDQMGETFNFLTFFALVLSLGIVVDSSIVMIEGIHTNMKVRKLSPTDAAFLAIRDFTAPVTASVLTTVAAFVPMLLMTGIMGEYVKHIPITINATLAASLVVSIALLSAVAVMVFRRFPPREDAEPIFERVLHPFTRWYQARLRNILASKWQRRSWMIGSIAAFIMAMALPAIGLLQVQMFPAEDQKFFLVNVEAPTGATLAQTKALTEPVEALVRELPEIDNFITVYGAAGSVQGVSLTQDQATITVNLPNKEDRERSSMEISDLLREKVAAITNVKVTVTDLAGGPPSGAPVEVRVLGDELPALEQFAEVVRSELATIAGTRDTEVAIDRGTGEFHLTPDRERLAYYGLTTRDLAITLRTAVFGTDAAKILANGDETPIVVRIDFRDPACVSDPRMQIQTAQEETRACEIKPVDVTMVESLQLNTPRGLVSIGEVASVAIAPAVTAISHYDRETIVAVRSEVEEGVPPTVVVQQLQAQLTEKGITPPAGVTLEFGGETEDTTESFASLGRALVIGLLLITLILVFQFNSFRQPLIILFTIPLSLIGVFIGLTLLGRYFSFPGFIGIVALAGIVVNNAIILIDRINHNLKGGLPKLEAIIESGAARMSPVILTTVTTIGGVLSLIIEGGIFADLALVVAVGLLFATVLTLVMVPILYNALESDAEIESVLAGMREE